MLPKNFDLEDLDPEIKNLVITLNRIPEVNKKTTIYGPTSSAGNILYYEGSPLHTKDGWIHFYKPSLKRTGLIRQINQFSRDYPYFSLMSWPMNDMDFLQAGLEPSQQPISRSYTLEGSFWSDQGYVSNVRDLYSLNPEEKVILIEKALARQAELHSGWNELDSRIKDYIRRNITKDIDSLPYISDKEEPEGPAPSCPHHFCF